MLSMLPRRRAVAHGPSIASFRLVSARTLGSVTARRPQAQAQVAEISSPPNSNTNDIPPSFDTIPTAEEATPPVRPVVAAVPHHEEFWRKVPLWRDVSTKEFLSSRWSVSLPRPRHDHGLVAYGPYQNKNMVQNQQQLFKFLQAVLPEEVPYDEYDESGDTRMQTRDEFVEDVFEGITAATMAVRMT
jgi:lysine 2,3-aminomutase